MGTLSRNALLLLGILLLTFFLLVTDGWWYQRFLAENTGELTVRADFLIIAHRGASADAPENTLPAFREALRQKADLIELDLHLSADGIPVVIHDAKLERTTNGQGKVADRTVAELQQLDAGSWFAPQFATATIPTLAEVLHSLPNTAKWLLELKNDAEGNPYPNLLPAVMRVIAAEGAEGRCYLQAFDRSYLADFQEMGSSIPFGKLLLGSWPGLGLHFDRSFGIGSGATSETWAVNPYFPTLTPKKVAKLQQLGYKVCPFTVNQLPTALKMAQMGVDGIITDRPGHMRTQLLAGEGTKKP